SLHPHLCPYTTLFRSSPIPPSPPEVGGLTVTPPSPTLTPSSSVSSSSSDEGVSSLPTFGELEHPTANSAQAIVATKNDCFIPIRSEEHTSELQSRENL